MGMYGCVGLCTAIERNVFHILGNGEPLYDAYTTYLPMWVAITASHILAGAQHVAPRVTEGLRPKGDRGTNFAVFRMCNETVTRSK